MTLQLKEFLDRKVAEYNTPAFIPPDPISIPHRFAKRQDKEIAGFFAASFAWGNRTTIIRKTEELMGLMGGAPHDFVVHHRESDLKPFLHFKHRTFNATDMLYFIQWLQWHYRQYDSMEDAFLLPEGSFEMEASLNRFHHLFFSLPDAPPRTSKHVAAPYKGSTCKRLAMYLRWMVRRDSEGVDFGLWRRISPAQLLVPIDLHVARVARRLGLLTRPSVDWQAALELTESLRGLDGDDPAKYDFALFGLGVEERF